MIGQLVGIRYELLEELSTSPIFDSYMARDRVRNIDVCVRLVNRPFADEPEFVEALASVIERAKALDHPNIARVYEMDEHEGRPYIVCELLRGSSLVERIRRVAPFSPPVACEIAIGICEALEHAALRGLPHGDLCSDHVLTSLEGRVAVIDFGLWESYGRSASAGAMVLSRMAPYLAPEIIEGELPTTSSDVYAVGVILYELLTGSLPYSGQTPMSILAKHTTQPTPSVRSLNPAVPHVLDEIISKALAKNKSARYNSATEMLADLRALRDALRFGKQVTWPLNQGGPEPVKTYTEKKLERKLGPLVQAENRGTGRPPTPVATRKEQKPRKPPKEPRDEDVPAWLRAIVYLLSGAVAAIIIGWMILNVTKKKELEVPNFVGMTLTEARQKAKKMGFNLSVISEEYNEKFPQPDTIIDMDPAPKTHVREGAYIQVKRSLGATQVDVPDVRGLLQDEARKRLEQNGLTIGQRVKEQTSTTLDEGMVIDTDPKRGEHVDRNTSVELTVSSGRTRPSRRSRDQNPEDQTPNTWTIRFKVRDSNEDVQVRVEMTDATGGPQVIYEESRPGGSYVEIPDIEGKGKMATFRIYFDNYLWRTMKREGKGQ